MPAPNHALTTRDDVKVYMNLTDTDKDEIIDAEIDAVSSAIEDYCNRTFVARSITAEKIDGDGTVELQLRFPIISIGTVVNDTITVVETTNWEQYAESGLVVLTDGTAWAGGIKKITITYRYGFNDGDLPRSVVSAANLWAMKRFSDVKENRVGVSSVTRGDESISYEKGMPKEVRSMVDPYRLAFGGWSA